MNSQGLHLNDVYPRILKGFYLIQILGNEDNLSAEPVLNNTPKEIVSQVCNSLNENMAGSPFSEVKTYELENPKNITIGQSIKK